MRKISLFALSSAFALTTLVGCNNAAEPVVEEPVAVEESSDALVEEPVVEESSDVIEEELTAETPVAVELTSEQVISYIDELSNKYPEQDSMEIVAGVISANIDNISEENMDILFNKYGCSAKDMNQYFINYFDEYKMTITRTACANHGAFDWDEAVTLRDEKIVLLSELFINQPNVSKTADEITESYVLENIDYFSYVCPEESDIFENKTTLNYASEELTDNTKAILNYFVIDSIQFSSDDPNPIGERISDTELPLSRY